MAFLHNVENHTSHLLNHCIKSLKLLLCVLRVFQFSYKTEKRLGFCIQKSMFFTIRIIFTIRMSLNNAHFDQSAYKQPVKLQQFSLSTKNLLHCTCTVQCKATDSVSYLNQTQRFVEFQHENRKATID